MTLTLPETLDTAAALRYLGVQGTPDVALSALMKKAEAALREVAAPRAVTLCARREQVERYLIGEDIQRHVAGCSQCVLMAVTLGAELDRAQRAANAADMAYAVVLDALSSVAAEAMADAAEDAMRREFSGRGLFLTGRFSPGYGDYPITVQNELIRLLDAPRRIGLAATPAHLLTPRKSITAVLGAADHPVTGRKAGCAHCALREKCSYRKEGKTCA